MHREDGFTLVELLVVLAIVAVLMTFGIVSYLKFAGLADDESVKQDLVAAVKVQALHHLETDVFTDDGAALSLLEPNLTYSDAGGTLTVVIEAGREAEDVCVFAQSDAGNWFAIYHSSSGGDRYGESAPIECLPANLAGWTTGTWG